MAKTSKLTLAFINKRAGAAARVLEGLPVEDATAFVDSIPARYAVKVLTPLNTTLVSAIVGRLPVGSATAILRDMEFALASAVLRRIHTGQQRQIMAELPERLRRDLQATMKFPADTVGAKMSTALVMATQDENVGDALKRVREDGSGESDAIYVIDDSHKLLGSVPLVILARRRTKTLLSDLLDDSCPTVSARARVSQVAPHVAWHGYNQLAVISRRGELIGIILKKDVESAIHGEVGSTAGQPSVVESLLHTMIGSVQAAATNPSSHGASDER